MFRKLLATATDDQAARIAADPQVEYVAQDIEITLDALQVQANPPSWGLDRIDQRSCRWTPNTTSPTRLQAW